VDKQARAYGHSKERETAYLVIHSVLQLLGYDHTDEAEGKKLMRIREEDILSACNAQGERYDFKNSDDNDSREA